MARKPAIKAKKAPKPPERPKIGGPFIAAAFFCENILEDMRGMMSVQGISDGITLLLSPHAPKDMPSKENPLTINHQLLLIFRSGDAPGKHKLKLEVETPSGKRTTAKEDEIKLTDPPHGGIHVKTAVTLSIATNGLFLIDVFLDDKLMTRMPLNIDIRRAEMPSVTAPEPKKKTETV